MRARAARNRLAQMAGIGSSALTVPPEAVIEACLDRSVLREALHLIGREKRAVLIRIYYLGHTYAEVSSALGIPEATARTRAFSRHSRA